jgi:hypothetical protein
MVCIVVCLAEYLHAVLIQGVIVRLTYTQGHPGIATFHPSQHAEGFGLLLEGVLLFIVFHLQQSTLALQF